MLMKWQASCLDNQIYNLSRARISARKTTPMHRHDFAEVFWIVQGNGTHLINGEQHAMHPGELCIIRPQRDTHCFTGETAELILCNLAFPQTVLCDLCRRYPDMAHLWQAADKLPARVNLRDMELQWLEAATVDLRKTAHDRLLLDRFLLNLTYSIRQRQTDPLRACPGWLQNACHDLKQPENLAQGIAALVKLGGHSRTHLARTLKKHTGLTLSAIVNLARLEHASGQLMNTSEPIQTIALDCGFDNLSYFYRLFRQRFGMPPRRFRLKHFRLP